MSVLTKKTSKGWDYVDDRINAQVCAIAERWGTPHVVKISFDVLQDLMRYCDIDLHGYSKRIDLMFTSSVGDIPMVIVYDRKDYVYVEDYLDVLAEKELLCD